MKRSTFSDPKTNTRPNMDVVKEIIDYTSGEPKRVDVGFEILGIRKPDTLSDSDMVGQPVFYERKLVGTIMDQWDGHSLVDINPEATFIIEDYKRGQILGKDIKIYLRG